MNGNSSTHQGGDATGSTPLRHSLDLKYIAEKTMEAGGGIMAAQANHKLSTPPRLQSSFSTNDVPTVKSPSATTIMGANSNNHAQQHFHNHNASLGRIPAGAVQTRGHNRDLSNDSSTNSNREQGPSYQSIQSALQANAAPFGPSLTGIPPLSAAVASSTQASAAPPAQFQAFYPAAGFNTTSTGTSGGNFGVPMLTAGMQQFNINGVNGGGMAFPPQNYPGYGIVAYNQGGQSRDSQARVIQHRRQVDNEGECAYAFRLSLLLFPFLGGEVV